MLLLLSSLALGAPRDCLAEADTVERLNLAVEDLNAGRLERAAASLEGVVNARPGCWKARALLGETRLRLGAIDAAEAEARRVIAQAPGRVEGPLRASRVAFARQDFLVAREAADAALRLAPGDPVAVEQWILVARREGRIEEALGLIEELREVLGADPADCLRAVVWVDRGEVDRAATDAVACLRIGDTRTWSAVDAAVRRQRGGAAAPATLGGADTASRMATARAWWSEGRRAEAEVLVERVLAEYPGDTSALLLRARIRVAAGDYSGAVEDLGQVRTRPTWVNVERGGGVSGVLTAAGAERVEAVRREATDLELLLLVRLGRFDEARVRVAEARAAGADGPELAASAAELELRAGETRVAWQALDEALQRWPGAGDLVPVAAQAMLVDPGGAPSAWVDRLARSPLPEVRVALVTGLFRGGDWGRCWEVSQAWLAEEPGDGHRVAAWCAARLDRIDDAQRLFLRLDQARILGDDDRVRWAWVLLARERWAEARDWLGAVADPAARDRVELGLLVAYSGLGDLEELRTRARDGGLDPVARANAGIVLFNGGRYADARLVLGAACPRLGPAEREACGQVLADAEAAAAGGGDP